jgi:hypothetical protein
VKRAFCTSLAPVSPAAKALRSYPLSPGFVSPTGAVSLGPAPSAGGGGSGGGGAGWEGGGEGKEGDPTEDGWVAGGRVADGSLVVDVGLESSEGEWPSLHVGGWAVV